MKKTFSQEILVIAILILTATVLWIYLSIYGIYHKKDPAPVNQSQIRVLDPNLDTKVLEDLNNRKY